MKRSSLTTLLVSMRNPDRSGTTHHASRMMILLLAVGFLGQVRPVPASPVVFTIDATRSHISLSGSVTIPALGSYAFQAQGSGSLVANYSGSIVADLAPPQISFPGGSVIKASNSGAWQLAVGGASGAAFTANYGIVVHPARRDRVFRDQEYPAGSDQPRCAPQRRRI